jgi:hypothetical protein
MVVVMAQGVVVAVHKLVLALLTAEVVLTVSVLWSIKHGKLRNH